MLKYMVGYENLSFRSIKWPREANSILELRTNVPKKMDRILIKDLISYKLKYRTKEARLILQLGMYIFVTYISEGTVFFLQGLTYYDKVKLRRYNLKERMACNMILYYSFKIFPQF